MHTRQVHRDMKTQCDFDCLYQLCYNCGLVLNIYWHDWSLQKTVWCALFVLDSLHQMSGNRHSTMLAWLLHCQILRMVSPDLFKMLRNWPFVCSMPLMMPSGPSEEDSTYRTYLNQYTSALLTGFSMKNRAAWAELCLSGQRQGFPFPICPGLAHIRPVRPGRWTRDRSRV